MRFLSIVSAAERQGPPSPEELASMDALLGEACAEGWLKFTGGCLPTALGARVRCSGGEITVTDGPFTESKEVVGGFAILEAPSKEAAIELCRRFMAVGGDGMCELRQLYEEPADGAQDGAGAKVADAGVAPVGPA